MVVRLLAPALAAVTVVLWPTPAPAAAAADTSPRYDCNGEVVSLAALRSPVGAQLGWSSAAGALRELLRSDPRLDDYTRVPRTTWRVLVSAPDRVTFGSALQRFGVYTVTVDREADGWIARPSFCELTRVGFTSFTLVERPRPTDRTVRARIDVGTCGEPPRVLAVRPRVTATRRSVNVLLRVRVARDEPPPGQICETLSWAIVDIPLGRRLGDRVLYDASYRPKRTPRE